MPEGIHDNAPLAGSQEDVTPASGESAHRDVEADVRIHRELVCAGFRLPGYLARSSTTYLANEFSTSNTEAWSWVKHATASLLN
jgi:hypothetical protein